MASLTAEKFQSLLKERLEAEHVEVVDTSGGCGAMFEIIVISPLFDGIPLLERHRLVNSKIEEELKNIHALSMKTWTPMQWETKKKVQDADQ
jgi:stress-induced morphogen